MDDLALFAEPEREVRAARRRCVFDPTLPVDADVEQRFWARVVKSSTCWWWTGAISAPDGYGRITWRRANRQRSVSAHRFALMLDVCNEISKRAVAEHLCNQPLCVRVGAGHLQVGTQAENVAYAVATGRHRGPQPVAATDRLAQSIAIRDYLRAGGDPDQAGSPILGDEPVLFDL